MPVPNRASPTGRDGQRTGVTRRVGKRAQQLEYGLLFVSAPRVVNAPQTPWVPTRANAPLDAN
eukprot:7109935-Prymnesium_polylepis.1